jgi:hypothetical protein
VIYGGWNFVDEAGSFIRQMTVFPFHRRMLENHGCYIASTSTFFRRSTTIEEGHLLNIRFKAVMDGEYFCRLAANGKRFVYLPAILADFRWHGGGISQQFVESTDINGVLSRQLQLAESRAIRRVYGITLFKDEMLNLGLEAFLYQYYRMWKGVLRLLNRHRQVALPTPQ